METTSDAFILHRQATPSQRIATAFTRVAKAIRFLAPQVPSAQQHLAAGMTYSLQTYGMLQPTIVQHAYNPCCRLTVSDAYTRVRSASSPCLQ